MRLVSTDSWARKSLTAVERAGLHPRQKNRTHWGRGFRPGAAAGPQRRTVPGGTYFATTHAWQRRAVFVKAEWAELVEAELSEYRNKGKYFVHCSVVMPEHTHVILTLGHTTSLERGTIDQRWIVLSNWERFATKFPVWRRALRSSSFAIMGITIRTFVISI